MVELAWFLAGFMSCLAGLFVAATKRESATKAQARKWDSIKSLLVESDFSVELGKEAEMADVAIGLHKGLLATMVMKFKGDTLKAGSYDVKAVLKASLVKR